MLSLAKPNQFYQVFLAQGVCLGIGAGLLYVPSIAVVSHYFRRRRVLAMAILATGSSFGSVIHPIMLNNTLYSSLGFGNSVRASAGLVAGMLVIANLLMRPRLPPAKDTIDLIPACKKFAKDKAYVYATIGYALRIDSLGSILTKRCIIQHVFRYHWLLLSAVLPSTRCDTARAERGLRLLLRMPLFLHCLR